MLFNKNEFTAKVNSQVERSIDVPVNRNAKPMITEIGAAVEVVKSGTYGGQPDGWTGYYRY